MPKRRRNHFRAQTDARTFTLTVSLMSGPVTEEFAQKNPVVARSIQLRGDHTLHNLHEVIFVAYDREEEHLYEFQLGGEGPNDPKAARYGLPQYADDLFATDALDATVTTIGSLELAPGDVFGYWFDFGDDWWHQVSVTAIDNEAATETLPNILERIGDSPPQYADFENTAVIDEEQDIAELEELLAKIPKARRDLFVDLVALTDRFCEHHLDMDYQFLCRLMAADICRKKSLATNGKPESWAAGIVYALGQVNFLTDPTQSPHMTTPEIARGFGISASNMQAKAKTIREKLRLFPFHPDWTHPNLLGDNPYVWLVEVNGIVIDIRNAPREAQQAAFGQGLIPYIPADS